QPRTSAPASDGSSCIPLAWEAPAPPTHYSTLLLRRLAPPLPHRHASKIRAPPRGSGPCQPNSPPPPPDRATHLSPPSSSAATAQHAAIISHAKSGRTGRRCRLKHDVGLDPVLKDAALKDGGGRLKEGDGDGVTAAAGGCSEVSRAGSAQEAAIGWAQLGVGGCSGAMAGPGAAGRDRARQRSRQRAAGRGGAVRSTAG
ncbi:hypothetical protein BS78_04G122700, partial [Paspalum vaginatum]